jgi:hypothetical protein
LSATPFRLIGVWAVDGHKVVAMGEGLEAEGCMKIMGVVRRQRELDSLLFSIE